MTDIINPYLTKQQLSEGVFVMEDGNRSWGGEVNHNFELLNSVLSKKTLTLTYNGEVLGTYDSRLDSTIDIPCIKNTLTISQNGNELGTFDNSENTNIDIHHYSLGIKYGDELISTFDNSENVVVEIPQTEYGTLTLTFNNEVIGTFKPYETKNINIGTIETASNAQIDSIFN